MTWCRRLTQPGVHRPTRLISPRGRELRVWKEAGGVSEVGAQSCQLHQGNNNHRYRVTHKGPSPCGSYPAVRLLNNTRVCGHLRPCDQGRERSSPLRYQHRETQDTREEGLRAGRCLSHPLALPQDHSSCGGEEDMSLHSPQSCAPSVGGKPGNCPCDQLTASLEPEFPFLSASSLEPG